MCVYLLYQKYICDKPTYLFCRILAVIILRLYLPCL